MGSRIKMKKPRVKAFANARVLAVHTIRTATERTTGTPLTRARRALFQAKPLCDGYPKGIHGARIVAAQERDHVVPLWKGGPDHETNTQGLCKECHKRKTSEENKERFSLC